MLIEALPELGWCRSALCWRGPPAWPPAPVRGGAGGGGPGGGNVAAAAEGRGRGRGREGAAFILPLYSTRFGVAGRIPYCVWGVAEQSERGLVKFPGLPPTPLPHLLETFPFLAMLFSVQEKG